MAGNNRLRISVGLLAGLITAFLLSHLLNLAAVASTLVITGDWSGWDYLWSQFYSMGFVFFYTLYILLLLIYLYYYPRAVKPNPLVRDEELPSVSIVIPAYNEEDRIGGVIENVLSIDYPRDRLEVIVVDDGSSDKTSIVASQYPVRIVRHGVNRGRGAAVMTGIRNAKGEIVITVDADTRLEKNSVKKLASIFRVYPWIGAACGRLKTPRTGKLLVLGQWVEYLLGYSYSKLLKSLTGWMLIPSGAFSAYRRSLVAGVDVSDTLAEDFDLGLNVIRSGYRLYYAWDAVAYTDVPETLGSFLRQRTRWSIGGLQVLAKHRDMLFDRKYGVVGLFGLPFHYVIGYAVMVMEVFGLSFLAGLALLGVILQVNLLTLLIWLLLLKTYSLTLLAPGWFYARRILGEKLGLIHLLFYWYVYYYLLLYSVVRGVIVYLREFTTKW